MKLEDLQEILAKMTPRPWRWDEDMQEVVGPPVFEDGAVNSRGEPVDISKPIIETDMGVYGPRKHDREGILALVNNAGTLLAIAVALRVLFQVADENGWVVGGVERRHAPQGEGPVVRQLRDLLAQLENTE